MDETQAELDSFIEGFAAIPLTAGELRDLKANAQAASPEQIRNLVREVEHLRSVSGWLHGYALKLQLRGPFGVSKGSREIMRLVAFWLGGRRAE